MKVVKSWLWVMCACLMVAGCAEEEPDTPGVDVCPAVEGAQPEATCSSRVDGKTGGEDCRCECDTQCAAGYVCQRHFCLPADCEVDDDCADGLVCNPGTNSCSAPVCVANEECGAGQACIGGTCTDAPDPGSVARCEVVGATVSRQGEVLSLAATSYSSGGAVVSQMSYSWSVTAGNTAATIDEATGALTGADADGEWTVTAAVRDAAGQAGSVTCTHTGANFADVGETSFRVLVMDQRTNQPVSGAKVVLSVDGNTSMTETLPSGQALFGDVAGTVDWVSVFYDTAELGADYVTLVGPQNNDLAIFLFTTEKGKKAGVEGSFDFSSLPDRQLKLGIAGASLAGSLADIDFMMLIGDMVQTQVDIPGLPIPDEGVPLPQGITMQFGPSAFKDKFQALTHSGTRTVWGLGGSFRLGAITELLPTIAPLLEDSSSGLPLGQLLGAIMPLFSQMSHAAKVGIKVDSVTCSEGALPNGDTVDCIEAFGGNFDEHTLNFSSGMDLKTSFAMPALPQKGDGYLSAVLGLIGVDMPGQGMVPLGLGVAVDDPDTSDDTPGDGQLNGMDGAPDGSMTVGYARSHSGLDGQGVLGLFLSLDIDGLLGGEGGDTALSGIVVHKDNFSQCSNVASCAQEQTRDAFMALPAGATWNSLTRSYAAPTPDASADFYRFGLEGDNGKWTFYHAAGAQFTVPAVPEGMEDRAENATVQAFDLTDGKTLDSMMAFNAMNMDNVNSVTSAFSSIDCVGGGAGCALTECDTENACGDGSSCVEGVCVEDEED
ncbi:MAG: hypothetical protein VYB65_04480 [Myxococcota bacterium]|nr:hypothetical protein [Myxococcota bacterium]